MNSESKVMTAEEAVRRFIHDGDCLALGGFVTNRRRTSDACVFASAAIHEGFPENIAYYTGKVLECASFCCEP